MSERIDQIDRYLDGELPEAEAIALRQWINADHMNARVFAERAVLHQEIRSILDRSRVQNVQNPEQLLHELLEHEAQAEADTVTLVGQVDAPATKVSAHDYAEAGRYLFEHALSNKRLLYTAGSAIAAVLLIALSLVFIFSGGQDEPLVDPLADATLWDTPTPRHLPVVATLTDAVGAQWRSDDKPVPMPMGAQLVAFERFTLTHGFAEITTGRGAIAVLEAPCTVELIDDNTVELTQGKLVGNVPPQAIGFTVNTPAAQVIDYGTTFGVEITSDGNTHTAVFEGEVELREASEASDRPKRSVRLTAGWASEVSDAGLLQDDPMPVTTADEVRYARSIDEAASPVFAYRRAVLASRPMVYWGFDEDKPATKNLASQAKWSGKAMGNTDRGEGVIGSALKLTGDIDTISGVFIDTPLKLTTTEAYTIEAWYHTHQPQWGRILSMSLLDPSDGKSWAHLAAVEVLGGASLSEAFKIKTGQARFYHRSELNQNSLDLFSNTPAPLGQWAHVVAVRDGQLSRLYINGQLVSEQQDSQAAVQDALVQLHVGVLHRTPANQERVTNPTVYRVFNGLIDEVAVYDHALAAERIASHYQLGINQSLTSDD